VKKEGACRVYLSSPSSRHRRIAWTFLQYKTISGCRVTEDVREGVEEDESDGVGDMCVIRAKPGHLDTNKIDVRRGLIFSFVAF
jgi:hypothetical protein